MSADGKDTACASETVETSKDVEEEQRDSCSDEICEKKRLKPPRKVCFPDDEHIVTQYFEPANPWQDVPPLSRAQLAAEYLESCRQHNTPPIESVLDQIRELPESSIGGATRAARLALSDCSLQSAAPVDALESVLRRVQFRRLELDHVVIDDEGAEALFDMVEYYESANAISVNGPRAFGVRGWQAVCRMVKKSCQLTELDMSGHPLEPSHCAVGSRGLHALSCNVTVLSLSSAQLAGDPLLCLVKALKSNNSVRELRLGDNELSPRDAAQLASLLRFNSRIRLLDLSNNRIQDAGTAHIAEALADQETQTPTSASNSPMSPHQCPLSGHEARGLAFLVLWNNQLTRNCAHHLSKALTSKSLCVLNIGRNALGGDTVRALGPCGALVSLGLQAARLGPAAAWAVADLIRGDHKLQRLDLRDNKLGEQGLQAILQALKDNTSLTQIDLDEPTDTSTLSVEEPSSTSAAISRLTSEIRLLCRRNEPHAASPDPRLHRKISLTCHSACIPRAMEAPEPSPRQPGSATGSGVSRLRSPLPSPAPSPAGSPVPAGHSRFSVTRVTPEREAAESSPSPRQYCSTSRFKVVQVTEPPKIHINAEPRRSRFSVTRNYDAIYTPTVSSDSSASSPVSGTSSPAPDLGDFTEIHPSQTDKNIQLSDLNIKRFDTTEQLSDVNIQRHNTTEQLSDLNIKRLDTKQPIYVPLLGSGLSSSEEVKALRLDTTEPLSDVNIERYKTTELSSYNIDRKPTIRDLEGERKNTDFKVERNNTALSDLSIEEQKTKTVVKDLNVESKNNSEVSNLNIALNTEQNDLVIDKSNTEFSDLSIELKNNNLGNRLLDNVLSADVKKEEFIIDNRRTDSTCDKSTDSVLEFKRDVLKSEDFKSVCESELFGSGNVKSEKIDKNFSSKELVTSAHAQKSHVSSDLRCPNLMDFESKSENIGERIYHDKQEQVIRKHCVDSVEVEKVLKTEKNIVKNSTDVNLDEKVDVKVEITVSTENYIDKSAKVPYDQTKEVGNIILSDDSNKTRDVLNINESSIKTEVNKTLDEVKDKNLEGLQIDHVYIGIDKEGKPKHKEDTAMKQIAAITEDLGNLIQEMRDLSTKSVLKKDGCKKNERSVHIEHIDIKQVPVSRDNVVLKKNKSESSLDSPDLEVSRLMNKKLVGSPFCDSSSSLEISGSSMESLNLEHIHISKPIIIQESIVSDTELDRRKAEFMLSAESSIESNTSEVTPAQSGFLNTSLSSTESVSPMFEKTKKIHGSLSSLEASVSSIDSSKHERHEKMVTSADSGIEYSLQQTIEKEDLPQNEGTLTNISSLKDNLQKSDTLQDTLTSPKRTSSLLDVPASKSKGLDRMRKISWVAPSSSCPIPKPEPEKTETKLPSNLEKLLSLFQHPTSLFTRSTTEEEKKSQSNTPPRKDSSLTSSFWSWGSATEKEDKEEKEDSSETTDSTLSERIQVSFVDESFSKKLDSKTPSTDTENTLSEFQSIQGNSFDSEVLGVTEATDKIVQNVVLSSFEASDKRDLKTDVYELNSTKKNDDTQKKNDDMQKAKDVKMEEVKEVRPRTFAAVLKSSESENSLHKQTSPEEGQPVDKLPSKVIRGIKENISPENTLTSSMTNTQTLAFELEKQVKSPVKEVNPTHLDSKAELKAPIATIEETIEVPLEYDDLKFIDEKNMSSDSGVTLEGADKNYESKELQHVDLGKDALSYLIYENQDFEPDAENISDVKVQEGSLADELKQAEIKEKLQDLSPELVIDEAVEIPVFLSKDLKVHTTAIPERAKLKKSNSLEDLPSEKESPKTKSIAFKIPETTPRDIPDRCPKLRTRSGSSPKSLPESLNKPCPLTKLECKKKKKVSSLGKIARDSLLALNMSEEEIAEFRRSYKLTSVESLRSLESVSEDANSQSGTSIDSRCRSCLRLSQESLMSLDSITEDCKCTDIEKDKNKLCR